MLLRTILICVSAFALSTVGAHARQEPQEIRLSAKKAFKHKHNRLEIPPSLDGIPRSSINALESDHLDVSLHFQKPGAAELISIFVYREVSGALPVWFDRARWAIETRAQLYGRPRVVDGELGFTPPGRANRAGLIAAYMPSAGKFQSTGVAMVPLGEWLVKIRYSSASIAPEALAEKIKGVLAELKWPSPLSEAAIAVPVEACATPLSVPERSQAASDGASNLAGALLAMPGIAKAFNSKNASPPRWCRDDNVEPVGSIYRPDGANDRYLIALSDAGRGIRVQPDGMADLTTQNAKPRWRIEMLDLSRTTSFTLQDRLPPPSQAIEIVENEAYTTRMTTWGKKTNIEVNSDALR